METFKFIEYNLQNNHIYFGIFFFIVGCCLASFFNVVIFRIPKMIEQQNAQDVKDWFEEKNIPFPKELEPLLEKINLSFPASHCYQCKTPLKWYHNIPIFSYLFLKGKCGHCNAPFSIQYPVVELLGGIILLSTYLLFIPQGLFVFILAAFLFLMCFLLIGIDLKSFMLPDSLTMALLWVGLLSTTFGITLQPQELVGAIYGAVIGYLILWSIAFIGKLIKGHDVMGNGDFKLLAALGTFIGVKGVIFTTFFSPFIGILTWLILKIIGKKETMVPYGPSLILAAIFYMFYGKEFLKIIGIYI